MYKNYHYVNADENEIHRYGKKARAKVEAWLDPNENGYYNFPVDGDKYWTIGTSKGKYGEFCKIYDTIFSVNSYGCMYARVGTEKGEKFVEVLKKMIAEMNRIDNEEAAIRRENGDRKYCERYGLDYDEFVKENYDEDEI